MTAAGYSQKPGPFAKFGGKWYGNGEIHLANGTKEVIKCSGDFVTVDMGSVANLKINLKCANPGYRFDLQSDLNTNGSEVTGTWTELSHGVNGKVLGRIKDDQISATAEGQTFTAALEIKNFGDKQHITLSSPGSEIANVLIGLLRSGVKPTTPPQTQ